MMKSTSAPAFVRRYSSVPAYVLHAFEKRSRKTAKRDVDLAAQRYQALIRQRQLRGLTGG